jgi:IS1 family transposase
VALSAEGVSRSAIARAEGLTWNTVDRWLDRAASAARQFNHCRTHGFALRELQADELHTYAPTKARPTWVFTTIEVWSRLWVSTVVGRRSYRNTGALLTDTLTRSHLTEGLLITTDGFEYYARVIRQLLGPACVYGQVVKSWRQGRVVKVDKRLVIGTQSSLSEALIRSEDSSDLNTAYIERLNLTLRQSCADLGRRRLTHARCETRVAHHLELLRCVYNFTRPHRAVRFGKVIRTPAMQAGLAIQRYSIKDIFLSVGSLPRKLASVRRITLRYPSCRLTRKLSTNTTAVFI